MKHTYNDLEMAHYGDSYVLLPDGFDLDADYENPRSYRAETCSNTGRYIHEHDRRYVRVIVDHRATGTHTGGTGDTVVRSIPRGWKSGYYLDSMLPD